MMTLDLDWDVLGVAFDSRDPRTQWYLNTDTGALTRLGEPAHDEGGAAEVRVEVEAKAPHLRRVKPMSGRAAYQVMQDFAASREDPAHRERLRACFEGRGAFRRFMEAIAELSLDEGWSAFHRRRLFKAVVAWLRSAGLEGATPPPVDLDAPEPPSFPAPQAEQAERLVAVAVELERGAKHARQAAEEFNRTEVPGASAHAWAVAGHLARARGLLDEAAAHHAGEAKRR